MYSSVKIHSNIQTYCLDSSHALGNFLQYCWRVDPVRTVGAVHLDGGEALRTSFLRSGHDVKRLVAPNPTIYLHAVAHAPAQELMYGHAVAPAFNVPERDIEAGEGGLSEKSSVACELNLPYDRSGES